MLFLHVRKFSEKVRFLIELDYAAVKIILTY